MDTQKRWVLQSSPGEMEIVWDETDLDTSASRLLAFIVSQAMVDGMETIRFRAVAETQELEMQYFGLRRDPAAQWWDMVSPPYAWYPQLVKVALAYTDVERGLPIRGKLTAVRDRAPVTIGVERPSTEELILTLPE